MATKSAAVVQRFLSANTAKDSIVTWTGLANGDDGEWVSQPGSKLKSISVQGTPGVGFAMAVNFSLNDGTVSNQPLAGAQGDETLVTGTNLTAVGAIMLVNEHAASSFRPRVTGGDGTTLVTIKAYFVAG